MNKQYKIFPMLFSGLLLLSGMLHSPVLAAASWSFIDGGSAAGINDNTDNNAIDPVMAVFNNELYAAWTENNGTATLIRVKKYNGTSWSSVTAAGGLNKDPTKNAAHPALVVFNGNLYASFDETNSSYNAIRVRRYDGGTTWTQVDGNTDQGLNRAATPSFNPSMVVYNNELYVAWENIISTVSYIHVRKYVSGTTWNFVDGGNEIGINHDPAKHAYTPYLTVCSNQLYCAWTELSAGFNQIRVTRFDNVSSWTFIDGHGESGLNVSSSNNASLPWLGSLRDTLYAAWDETDATADKVQTHLMKFNGISWTFADGGYLNRQSDLYAYSPVMTVFNNTAYITWDEEDQYPNYFPQIRAKQFNGSAFSFIDGGLPASQLNYDNTKHAKSPFPAFFNGDLCIAWYEMNGTVNQIRVKKYTLPPIVNSVSVPSDNSYYAGQNLDFIVNFNKAVNVTGTPLIQVSLGSGTKNASYLSGTATTALTFRYTVAAGDYDNNGIILNSLITLSGGTVREPVDNLDADVNLNNIAGSTGVLVDAIVPTVSSVEIPASSTYAATQSLVFTVNFSEAVTVVTTGGTPYIPLTLNTGGTVRASYLSGSGTTALVFSYTVVNGDNDNDGIAAATAIVADGGTLKDATGNDAALAFTISSLEGVLVDAVRPSILISSSGANPTNLSPIPLTITFSESVSGFTIGDIAVTNGTAGTFSGSSTTYTINITPSGQGAVTVNIAGSAAQDIAGNFSTAAAEFSTAFDNQAPSTAITSSAASLTNAQIPVTITFSESVGGFTISDIAVTNGTAGNFSGSGAAYSADITPSAQGAVTVNIAGGAALDAAGNINSAAAALNRTFDNQRPSVNITTAAGNPTNTIPIPVTIAFSEPVTVFDIGDISAVNGTVSNFTGSASAYSVNIYPGGASGAVTINIAENIALDAAGNYNTGAIGLSRTISVPSAVSLLFPYINDTVTADSTLVIWSKTIPNVQKYQIDISTDSLFVNSSMDSGVTDTLKTIRNLTNRIKYWWRVRARNSEGWGSFSSTGSFFIKKPIGNIILSGIAAADQVYLNATQGWYGSVVNKKDTIKDLQSGRHYYLSVRAAGKRPHLISVPVTAGCDTAVSITMKNAVALNFSDTVKMDQRTGVQMSLGSAACVVNDDINSDGNADIIAGFRDGSVYFFLYNSGEYVFEKSMAATGVLRYIRVVDFSNDGKPDLVIAFENGAIAFYSQQQNLSFSLEQGNLQFSNGLAAFDYEDFNYDGVAEIVVGFTDGTIGIAAENNGQYTVNQMMLDSVIPCNVGIVSGIEAVDISGDGNADIIAAVSDGTFKWFRNIGSRGFTAMGSIVSNGKPLSLGISPSISSVYGKNGFFPSLLIVNNSGLVYKVQGLLQGDFNGDGSVNTIDFGIFTDAWRTKQGDSNWNAKVNMDLTPDPVAGQQIINISDFCRFAEIWRNEQ